MDAVTEARRAIAHHSRSFSLAARMLEKRRHDDVVVLYAWCRRADDLIDHASGQAQASALSQLREELAAIYRGDGLEDPLLGAFQRTALRCGIPKRYAEDLLEGFAMDTAGETYPNRAQFRLYCYRVAGTVGVMMSYVLGVSDPAALPHAVHLGMAMQITNICRDVWEDWNRGRLYIPDEVLHEAGIEGLREQLGGPLPTEMRDGLAKAVAILLADADRYYRSADRGMRYLSWRATFAVRTARLVYAAIGERIRRQYYDVFAGRAYVPLWAKLELLALAAIIGLRGIPKRVLLGFHPARLPNHPMLPRDVLSV